MDKTMTFIYFPRGNREQGQEVAQRIRDFRDSGVRILDETSIEKSALSMVIFRYEAQTGMIRTSPPLEVA